MMMTNQTSTTKTRGYNKPENGQFIMRTGWTFPDEPCAKGHHAPRNTVNRCVQCVREYRKSKGHFGRTCKSIEWRQSNKEYLAKERRAYNHREPERDLLTRARKTAKKLGLAFDLTLKDIVIPPVCPVLGIRLEKAEKMRTDASPSIDKIIPKLGYVRGNVVIISMRANRIKNDATIDELQKVAAFYLRYQP